MIAFWARRAGTIIATTMLGAGLPAMAQVATQAPARITGAPAAKVERIKVHSPAILGNLEGETADRHVIVMLPPSYEKTPNKRYPVLYALHGYSIGAEDWIGEIHAPQTIEGAFAKGAKEMIVVFPDSKTVHNGSMYSASITTGDFESFIAKDLVAYIDKKYRTIARRESRGLAGHSMGGYGTARIGMKHVDTFGAIYMLSPCCLSARDAGKTDASEIAKLKTLEESTKLGFMDRANLAVGAAWAPNAKNPPFYLDLPVKDGVVQPDILAKWHANAPLAFVDQYIRDLRRYSGIAIDVGDKDGLVNDSRKLHEILIRNGINASFEIYDGDHTNRVAFRIQDHVIPFFSKHLQFESN